MDLKEMEAIGLPHKLFAVFTNPDGKLLFRKMWSLRLVGYLSTTGAAQGSGWDKFIKTAEVGQTFVILGGATTWMVIIRIRDDEDHDDTV